MMVCTRSMVAFPFFGTTDVHVAMSSVLGKPNSKSSRVCPWAVRARNSRPSKAHRAGAVMVQK